MKKILSIMFVGMVAFFNPALANCLEKSVQQKGTPNPMELIQRVSSMPSLMPIMVKNSKEIGLSQEQMDELSKWRAENIAPALTLAKEIGEGENAIKKAALDNKPKEEIEAMIKSVLDKRSELENKMLLCRENSIRILTESQWEQVVKLYREIDHDHSHEK